jgi:cytochrome b561
MHSASGRTRYSTVAIALHWSIAALIIFNLILGSIVEGFAPATRSLLVRTHASAGFRCTPRCWRRH